MLKPVCIELANLVTVQCSHDAHARKHRRPAALGCHQDQRLHGCLPFRTIIRLIAIAPPILAT
jgi:hypothetical protein